MKIAPKLKGRVVNVSGWRDIDKEGKTYGKDYFINASEYWITNWKAEARGLQGDLPNELFLDLELTLPAELVGTFDVVFNHTTLEHVFDIFKAFENLCLLSRDIVIVIVPFLQEQHGSYGDYWRLTPWAMKKMFYRFDIEPVYISFNDSKHAAMYVIGVGAKKQDSVALLRSIKGNCVDDVEKLFVGTHFFDQNLLTRLLRKVRRAIGEN